MPVPGAERAGPGALFGARQRGPGPGGRVPGLHRRGPPHFAAAMAALPPREFAAQVLPGCVIPTARQGLAQLWPLLLLCLGARLLNRLREWGGVSAGVPVVGWGGT